MHLPSVVRLMMALSLLVTGAITSPIPWPEEKLEAINALRAKGASEVRMSVCSKKVACYHATPYWLHLGWSLLFC